MQEMDSGPPVAVHFRKSLFNSGRQAPHYSGNFLLFPSKTLKTLDSGSLAAPGF
jgi:hypothetical protein